jgi:glycosyltransferase involved in cell wall biosynthesis
MERALRVLCLDIEGGHGGSSRSLFESLRHMDRAMVEPEVWCRRGGLIEDLYRRAGVPCRVEPALPNVNSLARLSRNFLIYGRWLRAFVKARPLLCELAREMDARFDVIHFNQEGFWLLARWLRPRIKPAFVMHLRTNLENTIFSRWQEQTIGRSMDHLVFITENERRTFETLGGRREGTVIFNVASKVPDDTEPHPDVPRDERFKIACLSNYSWNRGTDRAIEVAQTLASRDRRDFLFVMAGEMRLPGSLSGDLGAIGRRGGNLADYADRRGVDDMFAFLGHVTRPQGVLAACDVLIKPTRDRNPWGRDIIEALANGKPVLTVGEWDTFVTNGETGFMAPEFDAEAWASTLIRLAEDPSLCAEMGRNASERILRLCNGPDRAADLLNVWRSVAGPAR